MIVTDDDQQLQHHPKNKWQPTLTDIFVCELVGETNPLRLMLHRLPVYYRMFELIYNGFMDRITLCKGQCVR